MQETATTAEKRFNLALHWIFVFFTAEREKEKERKEEGILHLRKSIDGVSSHEWKDTDVGVKSISCLKCRRLTNCFFFV